MITPELISEISEERIKLSKTQLIKIYETIQLIPKYYLKLLSDVMYNFIIENADKRLKGHTLGITIFHLYNLNRLSTYVGIEKLFYAGITINPTKTFELLAIDKETKEISDSLRYIIETIE